jgi:nucleotide-binding universal stress UspA family protein
LSPPTSAPSGSCRWWFWRVEDDSTNAEELLDDARFYLIARGVSATYVAAQAPVAEAIQETAERYGCDLIVMGGYGFRPLLEVVLGSTVDQVMHWRRWPVLICR